jgi:hypothetical protein
MEMWVQLRDCDDDVHFSDDVTYEVHASGVLEIASRTDIHLYRRDTIRPKHLKLSTFDPRYRCCSH